MVLGVRMSVCLQMEAGSALSSSLTFSCSKSSGSAALLALTWTCLLVRIVFPLKAKRQGDIWNKLVGPLPLEPQGSALPRDVRRPSHPSARQWHGSGGGHRCHRNHILFTEVPKCLCISHVGRALPL